jgi:predicted RNA-binding Zn ribbon-like protein
MVTRSEPDYAWDFCGGQLAIDFTNTVGSRGGVPEEHFNAYADVLSWANTRGVIGRAEAQRLRQEAARRPAAAAGALASIVAIRESLYRVIAAAASGRKPAGADLARVNASVGASLSGAHLRPQGGRLELSFAGAGAESLHALIATPVVRAAIDLLTTDAIQRVRSCADESCAWLFVDTTRSGTRRWCDMKVCGNRNKVRRFREGQP